MAKQCKATAAMLHCQYAALAVALPGQDLLASCLSVCLSVCLYLCVSVCPSVRPSLATAHQVPFDQVLHIL